MANLRFSPAVSREKSAIGFLQLIELVEGEEVVGHARWMCWGEIGQGVAQVLELVVSPAQGRKGHGRILMNAITEQAREYFKLRKVALRRIWLTIAQEGQVIGRSFLMKFGFHHVGTVHELLADEDLLVYMRTFN